MNLQEYRELDAASLAARIRAGEVSPYEAADAALECIESVQPSCNPFAFVYREEARQEAREAERARKAGAEIGPLFGVPVAFKDFTPMRGRRTTRGSRRFERWIPDSDPAIVRRFRAAGAVVVGKTTTPEFAHSSFTWSPLWGHTRNPWNRERSAGGSSGGAGAAVASGCVPLAEGTDMGGSVRIPAALCGVVGLKPSLGRIPMDILDTVFDDMSHFGPLARTVADAALFLRVAEGPDSSDIGSQPAPTPLPDPLPNDVRGLRIGLSPDLGFYAVRSDVRANLVAVADALASAGAEVEEIRLDWEPRLVDDWIDLWAVYLAAAFGDGLDDWADSMDPELVALMRRGLETSAVRYRRIGVARSRAWRSLAAVLERHDALLCPTVTQTAPPVEGRDSDYGRLDEAGRRVDLDMTCPFNLFAQCPALTVPSGVGTDGMPTAVQIVARRFDDPTALRIGAAVERLRPWPQLAPMPSGARVPGRPAAGA